MERHVLRELEASNESSRRVDLRSSQSVPLVFTGAESVLAASGGDMGKLLNIQEIMFQDPNAFSPLKHLQLKAAISKCAISRVDKPTKLSLVVPMYHEEIRIAPKTGSDLKLGVFELPPDPNGENALLRKYAELSWLTSGSNVEFDLNFVDDLCDRGSGSIAHEIIRRNRLKNCHVHFLKNSLNASPGTLEYEAVESVIQNGGNSIRGGSLALGFAKSIEAMKRGEDRRTIIGYMDTDTSYSATQVGYPLGMIFNVEDDLAVTADRQHPYTYIEPTAGESQTAHRSPGLIRLKQVVGYLRKNIIGDLVPADTQSGFKLFEPDILEETLRQPRLATNFSYDTQLLTRISRMVPDKKVIETFPVVLLDSDTLSTANNGETYFAALEILKDLENEGNVVQGHNEIPWVLDYLTNDNKYRHTIQLLEDGSCDISDYGSDLSERLRSVRERIKIDRDTTAVGDYFTEDLFAELATVLKTVDERGL